MEQPAAAEMRFPEDPMVPDIYADGAGLLAGLFGFSIVFTRSGNDPLAPTPLVVVRMSPQQALVLARQLTRVVGLYEDQIGKITLPEAFLQSLGVAQE